MNFFFISILRIYPSAGLGRLNSMREARQFNKINKFLVFSLSMEKYFVCFSRDIKNIFLVFLTEIVHFLSVSLNISLYLSIAFSITFFYH